MNEHRAELVKILRQQSNKITPKKTAAEVNGSIREIKQAIKAYRVEEKRLFWELWRKYYNSLKWRPFF